MAGSRSNSGFDVENNKKCTQKFQLSQIKNSNKKGKGPWLRRPDTIHVKLLSLNYTKSVGF